VIREIQRVSRGNSFLVVDAWHNDNEHDSMVQWNLTAETAMHVDDRQAMFAEVGYNGDFCWFIVQTDSDSPKAQVGQ